MKNKLVIILVLVLLISLLIGISFIRNENSNNEEKTNYSGSIQEEKISTPLYMTNEEIEQNK